jgi:hypothetical protein
MPGFCWPWGFWVLRAPSGDGVAVSGVGVVSFCVPPSDSCPAAVELFPSPILLGNLLVLLRDLEDWGELRVGAFGMFVGGIRLPVPVVGLVDGAGSLSARRGCPVRSSILWRLGCGTPLKVAPKLLMVYNDPSSTTAVFGFHSCGQARRRGQEMTVWVSANRNLVVLFFVYSLYFLVPVRFNVVMMYCA